MSEINQGVHQSFMKFLVGGCGTRNTVCVFETVRETFLGLSITCVSIQLLYTPSLYASTNFNVQVVEKDSAVIDGSQKIGFDENHRNIQRFPSRSDPNYLDVLIWLRMWAKSCEESASSKSHSP
jgi:hypothetical protein